MSCRPGSDTCGAPTPECRPGSDTCGAPTPECRPGSDTCSAPIAVCPPAPDTCIAPTPECRPGSDTCGAPIAVCPPAPDTCNAPTPECRPGSDTCGAPIAVCPPAPDTCIAPTQECRPGSDTCGAPTQECRPGSDTCGAPIPICPPGSDTCGAPTPVCRPGSDACGAPTPECRPGSDSCGAPCNIDFVAHLGGGALTNKAARETVKGEQVKKAMASLAKSYKEGKRFIVVHGAGSFGKPEAKACKLQEGFCCADVDTDKQRLGFAKSRLSLAKLNAYLVDALIQNGVPAVAISVCGNWETECGKVKCSATSPVQKVLQAGFIPVLHGDCVTDCKQGCSVVGGDCIVEACCRDFKPKRSIFLMECDGCFDKCPTTPGAELIPEICVSKDGCMSLPKDCKAKCLPDTCGGLKCKMDTAACCASKHCVPTFMCGQCDAFDEACCTGNMKCGTKFCCAE